MVAIACAVLGLALVGVAFLTSDTVGYALGTDFVCRPIERRPSVAWLLASAIPFALTAALWIVTRRTRQRG